MNNVQNFPTLWDGDIDVSHPERSRQVLKEYRRVWLKES
jgi:hypothetical protein